MHDNYNHDVTLNKMAAEALPTKKGRGAMDREIFTLASKFSNKLSIFPNKDEGYCFPSDTRDFHPSA
jgi:hypothetical protein